MSDKPSRAEEEYFAKKDAEIRKQRRDAAEREAQQAERRTHYMKCPKCGADLLTEEYHGLEVDRCTECAGIWFDAGEAEQLIEDQPEGVARLFSAIVNGVRGKKPTPSE